MEEKAGSRKISEEDVAEAIENKMEEAVETARDVGIIENVMIKTVTTQMGFRSLMLELESGAYVIPGFQRMYRWTEGKVEELAISLVRGMPIPPIYGYRNQEYQFVILDGQQRILSLYFYYVGKFLKRKKNAFIDGRQATNGKLGLYEYLKSYGLVDKKYCMRYKEENGEEKELDITYDNLTPKLKRRINFAPITLVEINVDSEEHRERILHKIFANLNIGGLPLSAQELRNGVYYSAFYDMLYDINDNCKKWRILYSGSSNAKINKESKDVELLLQMCAFRYYVRGKGEEFILDGYKGKIASLLDDFSEEAKKFNETQIKEYKNALLDFFDSLEGVSGRNKNLALVSLFVVWGRMEKKPWISKKRYDKIVCSDVYRKTISSGTSGRNEIEKRLRSVYEQLSGDDLQD